MKKKKLERSISTMLYDRQITGKKLNAVKKSFQEVVHALQNDRKK